MLFALVIALSSSIVAVSAVSRSSAERAADFKDSTTKLVNKNIHALAEAGFAGKRTANLRKKLDDTEYADAGFIYFDLSTSTSCKGTLATAGMPANRCTVGVNYAYKLLMSADVDSCDGAIIEYFGDKDCTESLGTNDLADADFSCKEVGLGVLGDETVVYGSLQCTKYAAPRFSTRSGVTEYYVNSTDCADGKLDVYVGIKAETCLNIPQGSFKIACEDDDSQTWAFFEGVSDCAGEASGGVTYPLECQDEGYGNADDDDDAGDDDDLLPPPPSVSTTAFPTSSTVIMTGKSELAYCASATSVVKIAVTQTISGFSLDTFNEDPELYTMTFKQAIAATMDGVSSSDITDFTVTASAAARLAPAQQTPVALLRSFVSRLLTTESVDISYTVTVATTLTADELTAQLTEATEDGTFNDLLHDYATANGATALTTATSEPASASTLADDDGAPVLDTGAIIGIAIGGFVFVALVVTGIVFMCRGKSSAVGTA